MEDRSGKQRTVKSPHANKISLLCIFFVVILASVVFAVVPPAYLWVVILCGVLLVLYIGFGSILVASEPWNSDRIIRKMVAIPFAILLVVVVLCVVLFWLRGASHDEWVGYELKEVIAARGEPIDVFEYRHMPVYSYMPLIENVDDVYTSDNEKIGPSKTCVFQVIFGHEFLFFEKNRGQWICTKSMYLGRWNPYYDIPEARESEVPVLPKK